MKYIPGIKWKSKTIYVDIDTGEQLNRKTAIDKYKYITIKTIKNVRVNNKQTKGVIIYTRECRKQPQQELNFSNYGKNRGDTIYTNKTQ